MHERRDKFTLDNRLLVGHKHRMHPLAPCRSVPVYRVFLQAWTHNDVDISGLSRQVDLVVFGLGRVCTDGGKRYIMKGARRSIVIVFSLSIVVLSFLPSFLCWRPVIRAAFGFVTHHDVGTLEVQSCSLGWWQGLSC